MDQSTILTIEEIESVSAIDDLIRLYDGKGIDVKNLNHLLALVKHDWLEKTIQDRTKKSQEYPESFPSLMIDLEDITYDLAGVTHISRNDTRYLRLLFDWMDSTDFTFFEFELGNIYLKTRKWDMLDWNAKNLKDRFMDGYIAGKDWYNQIKEFLEETYGRTNIFKNIARDRLSVSYNESFRLPMYILLEIMHDNKVTDYPVPVRRSAYMAEFLRASKSIPHLGAVVGRLHVKEIEYFLKYGSRNQQVIDKAHNDRILFETRPQLYHCKAFASFFGDLSVAFPAFFLGALGNVAAPLRDYMKKKRPGPDSNW